MKLLALTVTPRDHGGCGMGGGSGMGVAVAMGWGVAVSGQGSGAEVAGVAGVAGLTLRMSGLRSMLSRTKPSRSFSVPGPASAKVMGGRRRDPALPPAMAQGGRSRPGGGLSVLSVLVLVPGGRSRLSRYRGCLSVPGPDPDPGGLCRPRCRGRGSPTGLAARAAASVSRQQAVRRSDGSGWGRFRRGNG